jgi:hypothetical protein
MSRRDEKGNVLCLVVLIRIPVCISGVLVEDENDEKNEVFDVVRVLP